MQKAKQIPEDITYLTKDGRTETVTGVLPGNGRIKRRMLAKALGISHEAVGLKLVALYKDGMSGPEVAEWIREETGLIYSPRSIQRLIEKYIPLRGVAEAFRVAAKKGRVVWQVREQAKKRKQIAPQQRFRIMKRDEFKCVLCGSKELLQIDHIVARVNGGSDDDANLRTLCLVCNEGKRLEEKEFSSGSMRSGRE